MIKRFPELTVAHKLMLMSVFFLLPDSIMLYLVLSGINDNLVFTRQEMRGNQYLRPLVHLQHLLPEHQRLARANAAGDSDAAAKLPEVTAAIDKCLTDLDEVDAREGADLQFTDQALASRDRSQARPVFVRADWQKLRDGSGLDSQTRAGLYNHALGNVRLMIRHAGDMSNLILDPDLDTYYMMDATLLSLPKDQDELALTIDEGERYLTARPVAVTASNESVSLTGMHAAALRDLDLDHLVNSIKTALREDHDFYGTCPEFQHRMPSALNTYLAAVTPFIEMTEQLDHPAARESVTPAVYAAAGEEARAASLTLWDESSTQLDSLLQLRINYFQGRRMISLSITALSVLSATFLVTFINRSINRPLRKQADQLRELNAKLAAEMLERASMESALLAASHKAGMAEIATGVLHNVGNVLNSVNTSATVIRERLDKSKVPTFSKAAEMIIQHRADAGTYLGQDSKGKLIPDLLKSLAEVMAGDRMMMTQELSHLSRNLEHIKHIVHSQQAFARVNELREDVNLAEAVEDALCINGLADETGTITIARDFQPCAPFNTNKHKLLQILVNLVSNAKNAVMAYQSPEKRINISVQAVEQGRLARILVTDTGVGIKPEDLKKIFQHGFTTRKEGHGFGLHTAAIDAHQMGGSISVTSPGHGAGATFVLEIPLKLPAVKDDVYDATHTYSG